MTAIAYRDGVMAADSQAQCQNIVMGFVTKIARRADGALAGAAGAELECSEFMRRFIEGTDEDYHPTVKDPGDFSAVVVTPDGQIWQVNERGRFMVRAPFYTEGSAYQILIGAMAAGASAEEAVAIAIKYDTRCGGEIQVERLGALEAPRMMGKINCLVHGDVWTEDDRCPACARAFGQSINGAGPPYSGLAFHRQP